MIQLKIEDDDIATFDQLRKGQYAALLFGLSADGSTLVLLNKHEKGWDLSSLVNDLPKDQPVWAFLDFHFETDEKPPRKSFKLIMVSWCPETVPVRKRFPFAAAKDGIKNAFTGIQKEIQAADYADVDYDVIRKQLF